MPSAYNEEMVLSGASFKPVHVIAMTCAGVNNRTSDQLLDLAVDLDLSPCLKLERVGIQMLPGLADDEEIPGVLRALFNSWRAQVPLKTVCLIPYVEYAYTRQEYADILSTMGHILEEWLGDTAKPPSVDKASSGYNLRQHIIVDIHDREVWHGWWLRHIGGCFPTFARFNGLKVNCSLRELPPEIHHC